MSVNTPWTEGLSLRPAITQRACRLLIDGEWREAQSGRTFPVTNPATGEVIARVAAGEKADVDLAVAAARRAFEGSWASIGPAERGHLLWKLGDMIEAHADEMALIETLDNGKPLRVSRASDIAHSAEKLRYYAGWCTKLSGKTMELSHPGQWGYTLREPIGVTGLIAPWNFPLLMAVSKIGAALAAGCTAVLKPAEQTPLTALRLGEFIQEIGFPPGAINIITGFGETAGAAIAEHPGIDKVSFTGSTEVGKIIIGAARGNLKRVTLELGGKSPVVVFPDADLDKAADAITRSIFFNAGQSCVAGSRLFVHRKVYDEVVRGVAQRAAALKIGPGVAPDTELGPLVSQEQHERVGRFLREGASDGAKAITGGALLPGPGYFVQPTVLTEVRPEMSVYREEIFGPVLCAMSFEDDDVDSIVAQCNDSNYGLSSYVWTSNVTTAHQMARRLKAGMVRINSVGVVDNAMPFGGVKQSGWGRENGLEGVEIFTEVKSVMMGF